MGFAEGFIDNKWVIADPTFGKHTEKLVSVSQLGREPWMNAKNINKMKELSPFYVWIGNFFIPLISRKVKKAIEETCY